MAISWIGREYANTTAASSTNLTLAMVSGWAAGDLLIAFIHSQGSTVNVPSGWTLRGAQQRTTGNWIQVVTRVAESGDSNPTFTMTAASTLHFGILTVYRGVGNIHLVSQSSIGENSSSYAMPTVSTAIDGSAVLNQLFLLRATTGSVTSWSGGAGERSDTVDFASGAYWNLASADQIVTTGGTSVPVTATLSSSSGTGANGVVSSIVLSPPNNAPQYVDYVENDVAADSVSVTYPGTQLSTDLAVAFVSSTDIGGSVQSAISAPAGWTKIVDQANSEGARSTAWTKIVGADTGATFTADNSSNDIMTCSVMFVRNVDGGVPVSVTASGFQTTNNISIPVGPLTTTTPDNLVFKFVRQNDDAIQTLGWPTSSVIYNAGSPSVSLDEVTTGVAMIIKSTAGEISSETVTSGGNHCADWIMVSLQGPQETEVFAEETATGTDSAYVTGTAPPAVDAGQATENNAEVVNSGLAADSGGATAENASTTASVPASETSSVTEDAYVTAYVTADGDSSTSVEDQAVSNTVLDSDSGAAVENPATATIYPVPQEGSSGVDAAQVAANVPVTDSVSGTEGNASISTSFEVETVVGSESQHVIVYVSDSATAVDDAPIPGATVYAQDTAEGSEDQQITTYATKDEASGNDNAVRSVEGVLVAPRVYTIYPDNRWYDVPGSPRVLNIQPQIREYVIPSQGFTNNN